MKILAELVFIVFFFLLFLFYRKYDSWKGTDQFVSREIKYIFFSFKMIPAFVLL